MGSLFYLIPVGLTAVWIIVVFLGIGLFSLVPRSAKLAPGSSPVKPNFDASSAETPWLMQSTSTLGRLSASPPAVPLQPLADAATEKNQPILVPGSPDKSDVNSRPAPAEPAIANTGDEPRAPAPPAELGTAATASEAASPPSPDHHDLATGGPPVPTAAPHSAPSRKRHNQNSANKQTRQARPPTHAIQDVLQRHSGLLK